MQAQARKLPGYKDVERDITLLADVDDIAPYHFKLPEPPPIDEIKNYGLPIERQFYQREEVPKKIWELTRKVNHDEITREEARLEVLKDKELTAWVQQQWHKREHGEWCYVYGHPFYITGTYWFYLNYYHLDTGLPQFRVTDLKESWWWKFCVEEDDNVYGGIQFTRRRSGKTFKLGNIQLEYITRTPNANSGLQSKNDVDAGKAFQKAIMNPMKRLPFFFKPEWSDATGTKKRIDLSSDKMDESFESLMDFAASVATAYDGQKVHRYGLDEGGKMEDPADPVAVWDKVKWCLFLDGKVIGKAMITTTVEEMERGGGAKFKYLWVRSSRKPEDEMMNEYGETKTGLVPYFVSSYENMFFDQYGFSIVDTPKPYQAEWRRRNKDKYWNLGGKAYVDMEIANAKDGRDRQDKIRKMPRTIREAFRYNNTACLFDIDIINTRLDDFMNGYPAEQPMTFGYLDWEGARFKSPVKFIATDERSKMCKWHFRHLPLPEQRNAFYIKNNKQCPTNIAKFQGSADPFKLAIDRVMNKDKMSLGGGHIYALFDPMLESMEAFAGKNITDNFVAEYYYRPPTPDEYAEDMLMACIFYGCKCYPEFNVDVVDKFFREHGFEEYLQFKMKYKNVGNTVMLKEDKTQAGSNTTEQFKPVLIRHGINYIQRRGAVCPFPRTLEQFRDLEYANFNDYDLAVSALYGLVAIFDMPIQKKDAKKVNMRDFVPPLNTWGRN